MSIIKKTLRDSGMSEIQSVSNNVQSVANVQHKKQIVERIYKTSDGDHRVEKTFYNITLYDSQGSLKSVTNSHQINYLI